MGGKKSAAMARSSAAARRQNQVNGILFYGGWGGGIFIVVAMLLNVYYNLTAESPVKYIDGESDQALQEVFFGGQPWVVLCADSKKALVEGELRETYTAAADNMKEVVKFAAMSCNRTLPSGKTVYERLKLDVAKSPVMFLSVGGDKPIQLLPALLKKPKKKKNQEVDMGKAITEKVKTLVGQRYTIKNVQTSTNLLRGCIDRKACMLVFGNGPAKKALRTKILADARKDFPLIRWAYVNTAKYKTTVQNELIEAKGGVVQMAFFREGKYEIFPNRLFPLFNKDMVAFLEKSKTIDYDSMTPLKKIVKMARRKKETPKPKKEKKEEKSRIDEQLSPEQARAAQLKREHRIRMAMEEEMDSLRPEAVEEFEEGEGEEANEEDEEEEDEEEDEIML